MNALFVQCVALGILLLTIQIADANDSPAIDDGHSDYRYVKVGDDPLKSCVKIENKYVRDHKDDAKLKIRSGDSITVFLRGAYFSGVKGFFTSSSEAAILLNIDTNAPYVKKNPGDYGRLAYYTESAFEKAPVNASFVIGAEAPLSANYLSIDATVIQFDSANSAVTKSLLKTLVTAGSSVVNPAVVPLLNSLGTAIGKVQSGGTRSTQYRMGFILDSVEPKIRQPILREGDVVLITANGSNNYDWSELLYDHRNGGLYLSKSENNGKKDEKGNLIHSCDILLTNVDYLVFTIRKNVSVGLDATKSQSLGDVIEYAKARTTTQQAAVALATQQIKDLVAHDAAKDAINTFNSSANSQTKRLYLSRIAMVLGCAANGNAPSECANIKVDDSKLVTDLQHRVLHDNVMCSADLDALFKPLAAGATIDSIVKPVVDTVSQRKPGADCP